MRTQEWLKCCSCNEVLPKLPRREYDDCWEENITGEQVTCPYCDAEFLVSELDKVDYVELPEVFNHKDVTDEVRDKVIAVWVPKSFLGVAPSDEWYTDQPYDLEDYLLPTFKVIQIDPTWIRTQRWWQEVASELEPPVYVFRMASTGNSGSDFLLDKDFQIWHDTYMSTDVGIEYGASGPAFNGCYCEDSRKEILEWVGQLESDMDGSHDLYL